MPRLLGQGEKRSFLRRPPRLRGVFRIREAPPLPTDRRAVTGARSRTHLTTQKSFYVEISRVRDRAELVTDDKAALKEQLETVTGERIAALEGIAPEPVKDRDAGGEEGRIANRESGDVSHPERERTPEAAIEQVRAPKGFDRDLAL